VSFARKYEDFEKREIEVVGITVESPAQNQGMINKLLLPFNILSDPYGNEAMKRYGVWDAQGRVPIPSIVAVGRDLRIRYLYRGKDFADRPGDEELLAAVTTPEDRD
jgi:peroxiredoxin